MRKTTSLVLILILLLQFSISTTASTNTNPSAQFSDKELDELLGPIALYPDPLLAQVVPAATFVDQVVRANQLLKGSVNEQLIEKQTWDVSVKSVAHYPSVLELMAKQRDWTTAVGQAYVYQSTDVMKSIQRLRALAKQSGALVSTPQQTVTVEKEYITIVPAQPQVIYVPTYDPQVVYFSSGPPPGSVAIAFGVGLAIGAWLNRDWHWYGPGIYYHGWVGVGWINVNRTYVHINHYYVNRNFTHVNINRTVVNRNITTFRSDLNYRAANGQHLDINRGNVSRDFNRPPTASPARSNASRQNVRTPTTSNRKIASKPTTTTYHRNTPSARTKPTRSTVPGPKAPSQRSSVQQGSVRRGSVQSNRKPPRDPSR